MCKYEVNGEMLVVFKSGEKVTFKSSTTKTLFLNEDEILYVEYIK